MPRLVSDESLLLGQWVDAPNVVGLVRLFLSGASGVLDAVEALDGVRLVGSGEGVWLDAIGGRLGLARPFVPRPEADVRFGFDDAGVGFDRAAFRGRASNDQLFPLGDVPFRRLLTARGITLLGDGSLMVLRRAVLAVDPDATVVDGRDMTVTVTTRQEELLTVANETGCLPRPAGVNLVFVQRTSFPLAWEDDRLVWGTGRLVWP